MRALFQFSFWALLLGLPQVAFSYAYLSEFVSSDFSILRDGAILSSDQIIHPRWPTGAPIPIEICAGGTAYQWMIANNRLLFETDAEDEILADLTAALDSWELTLENTGSALQFAAPTLREDCGPNLGQSYSGEAGKNQIYFTNTDLGNGVLGQAFMNLELVDGELQIERVDIAMNASMFFSSQIRPWMTSALATRPSTGFSFLGVLTHELGHFAGLAHSLVTDDNEADEIDTTVTMFPLISGKDQSEAIEALSRDDQLSILNLYPAATSFQDSNWRGSISGKVERLGGVGLRGAMIHRLPRILQVFKLSKFAFEPMGRLQAAHWRFAIADRLS